MTPIHQILYSKWPDSHWRRFGKFRDQARAMFERDREVLATAVAIDATNVYENFEDSEPDTIFEPDLAPNVAPPFDKWAVIFPLRPHFWGLDRPEWAVVAYEAHEAESATGRRLLASGRRVMGDGAIDRARWLLTASGFQVSRKNEGWHQAGFVVAVRPDGRICAMMIEGRPGLPRPADDLATAMRTIAVSVPLRAVSFMHCKNVATEDVTRTRNPTPEKLRSMKLPRITIKQLVIDPTKPAQGGVGGDGAAAGEKAWHIRRGHFMRHPNGLFNRTPGREELTWVPQHARGSSKNGLIFSDYVVKGAAHDH